jgi:hypothetical protein
MGAKLAHAPAWPKFCLGFFGLGTSVLYAQHPKIKPFPSHHFFPTPPLVNIWWISTSEVGKSI